MIRHAAGLSLFHPREFLVIPMRQAGASRLREPQFFRKPERAEKIPVPDEKDIGAEILAPLRLGFPDMRMPRVFPPPSPPSPPSGAAGLGAGAAFAGFAFLGFGAFFLYEVTNPANSTIKRAAIIVAITRTSFITPKISCT